MTEAEMRSQIASLESELAEKDSRIEHLSKNAGDPSKAIEEAVKPFQSELEVLRAALGEKDKAIATKEHELSVTKLAGEFPEIDLSALGQGSYDELKDRAGKLRTKFQSSQKPPADQKAPPNTKDTKEPPKTDDKPDTSRWQNAPGPGGSVDLEKKNAELEAAKRHDEKVQNGDVEGVVRDLLAGAGKKLFA